MPTWEIQKSKPCPECGGSGIYTFWYDEYDDEERTCWACDGVGRFVRPAQWEAYEKDERATWAYEA